ncbi:MAG: penicillin-binding transpeptidase domain-containing protein [candidate division FCPU426 bacterium]
MSNRRLVVLAAGFGAVFVLLTGRLFYLQIIQHQHLSQLAFRQQERTIEVQPARGRIFDRQGRPLALNREVRSFYAVPAEIKHPRETAARLSGLLGVSAPRLEQRLRSRKAFVWIKRKVEDNVSSQVLALKLPGIHALKETERVYPEGRLACHVLGFAGLDNQGLAGIELSLDRDIRGQSGWIRIARDARGQALPATTRVHKTSHPGLDVYLTLDKVLQHIAERELAQGLERSGAKAGSALIMDPRTGEILALANQPDFDPNDFGRFPAGVRRNRAICDIYEPGSTFKLVTLAAALEERAVVESDVIDCEEGHAVFSGLVVRDHEPRGRITVAEILRYSSNIGAVKIGLKVGAEKLSRYAQAFGFGRPTQVDLPGEVSGLLRPFREWRRWTAVSVPFGQGVAVTTMQMASAYATVANDGLRVRPWIVKELRRPDDLKSTVNRPLPEERVISAQTASRLRTLLADVVREGTGVEADLQPYSIAGKTGTAQKSLARGGGYDPVHHVASFIGFLPAERPQYLITVVMDEPRGVQWGGTVAGPVFREITRQLVAYAGLPPNSGKVYTLATPACPPDGALVGGTLKVPACSGLPAAEAENRLRKAGLRARRVGGGEKVLGQRPAAGLATNADSPVMLYCGDQQQAGERTQVVMPRVSGHSLRDALRILDGYGLRVEVTGSGMVYLQEPRPLALVRTGEVCTLHCEDPEASAGRTNRDGVARRDELKFTLQTASCDRREAE